MATLRVGACILVHKRRTQTRIVLIIADPQRTSGAVSGAPRAEDDAEAPVRGVCGPPLRAERAHASRWRPDPLSAIDPRDLARPLGGASCGHPRPPRAATRCRRRAPSRPPARRTATCL